MIEMMRKGSDWTGVSGINRWHYQKPACEPETMSISSHVHIEIDRASRYFDSKINSKNPLYAGALSSNCV